MANGEIRINDDVAQVLDACQVNGNALVLTGQLDRSLYTATNKIIEALGGKWNRSQKAHIFADDPAARIADALATRAVVDEKKLLQFYETPDDVADLLIGKLDLEFSTTVLEPSAGHGALIRAIERGDVGTGVPSIKAIEIDPKKCEKLRALFPTVDVTCCDFLTMEPFLSVPLIVMNPPFTRQQDIQHVRHAFEKWLAPGGRLVAVMSNAWPDRTDKRSEEFQRLVDENDGQWDVLPEGAFASSGTMVRTGVLTIEKIL